jgi:predicted nucleic acid-binding protein
VGKKRTVAKTPGLTLDTGALIALDRGDGRMIALLSEALRRKTRFHVPAGVVGQAVRDRRRQATLLRFLRTEAVSVVPLDGKLAEACGELCANAGTSDVIDASVVLVARELGEAVISGDAKDLGRLDPACPIVPI